MNGMRNIKANLLIFCGFLCANTAFANIDEKALLQSVMPTACHFSGGFMQSKTVQGLPKPLVSEGEFFFSCDMGMIWQTQAPFAESLIYSNYFNYRIIDDDIEKLSSLTHYGMSKVMLKMLNGDVDYFAKSFEAVLLADNELSLSPESKFMKKAIDKIILKKIQAGHSLALHVSIYDRGQQLTTIAIDKLVEYDLKTKQRVQERCEEAYLEQKKLCEVLRFPARFDQ